MQLQLLFSRWTQVGGLLLAGGALAWAIKLSVIVATDGRIIDTGAAALFMRVGLLFLFIGSTGIGHRLSQDRGTFARIVAMILSPVVVFGSIFLIGMITGPLFSNTSVWYLPQEGPIGVAVIMYLTIGLTLYKSYKPVAA